MPLATLFALGRHMGATLPENLAVEGTVSGSASLRRYGLSGQLTVSGRISDAARTTSP